MEFNVRYNDGGNNWTGRYLDNTDEKTTGGGWVWTTNKDRNVMMRLFRSGSLKVTNDVVAKSVSLSSDDRLKINEKMFYSNSSNLIMKLKPQIYTKLGFNIGSSKNSFKEKLNYDVSNVEFGLIAQEVYTIPELRNLVNVPEDSDLEKIKDTKIYEGNLNEIEEYYENQGWGISNPAYINYNGFIPLLIKGFQEQQILIQNQKTEFETKLENQITEFEIKLENQKTEFETKLENQKTKFETKLENQKTEFETKLENQITEFETKLENQKTEFETEIKTQLENQKIQLKTKLENQKIQLETQLKNQKTQLETQLKNQKTQLEMQLEIQKQKNIISENKISEINSHNIEKNIIMDELKNENIELKGINIELKNRLNILEEILARNNIV